MLDTDSNSTIIRDRPESVRVRFGKLDSSQVCISVIPHGDAAAGNVLIQGDNLEALLPLYRGWVKCIYIDPPTPRAHSSITMTIWSAAGRVGDAFAVYIYK